MLYDITCLSYCWIPIITDLRDTVILGMSPAKWIEWYESQTPIRKDSLMQSFTQGSPEYIREIIEKGTKEKYTIELNAKDFTVFAKILYFLENYAKVSHSDIPEIEGYGGGNIKPLEDWAYGMLSGIGDSLGVEGI